MAGICGTSGMVTSESQLSQEFSGSILPAIGSGRIESGELKGRLTAQKLEDIYQTLVTQKALVSNADYKTNLARLGNMAQTNAASAQEILDTLGQKETATMRKIQEEYCFNYFRYKFTLETLFDKLVQTSKVSSLTDADKADIQSKLNKAKVYNEKLNDLIQITNYIAEKRAAEMREQTSEINAMNTGLAATFQTLQTHRKLLNSETSVQDLRKRMVEFTEEKNRSAVNLLSLFGFMNLVAIGLLFYIARS